MLEQAIFDAVLEQLRTSGYAGLTLEAVAAAAQTGKSALYRRWSGKEELVADALRGILPSPWDIELTDDLRADLLRFVEFLRDAFAASYGTAFQIVSAEVGSDSSLVRTLVNTEVIDPCVDRIMEVLRAGRDRGEVRPEAVTDLVARTGAALVTHHCVTGGEPSTSDEFLVAIVDEVLLPLVRTKTAE
ncbi:TetR/AcrR family transcriptional regulator [Saccharopolyspora hirsuta]|uniref:TetR/AcrR family transcriptional regulator n=1 Tax=Saccharopolyspora hirsuta TaxID=1837 RepID=UPI001BA83B21|nr:TetR/AcrR family transcriptional regulator [Saccharopolyspora hirsuta]